ncbi:MAG: glycoside hydrolase family 88 protein [Bacteroidia bacterium]|nr:glycoside hydrolase family 88 protein [Bacteroidia bacterium]
MRKVADWQIANFEESVNKQTRWKNAYFKDEWTQGALYVGMVEWAKLSKDEKYWNFLKSIGEELSWKPAKKVFFGDDICVSRMYLELYKKYKQPEMIAPTIERLDYIIQHLPQVPLQMNVPGNQDRWSWCDAIFMAPPVFYSLSKITGNDTYRRFAEHELDATYDTLYVKTDSLFLRDTNFKNKKEKNGKQVYWARGNGWVVAGLANIITNTPQSDPYKANYIQTFKEMTTKIATLQGKDGFWTASLLDPSAYPVPETSSTGFMTYAIAWGINQGYLDKTTYAPFALNGWKALVSAIEKDGKLGWAQAIGAAPGATKRENSEVYGVGSFLLAGTEVIKLVK